MTLEEAYVVKDLMSLAYEEIGGWKIGAPSPEATPSYAPMPKAWIWPNGVRLCKVSHRYEGWRRRLRFGWGRTCRRGTILIRGTR